MVCVRRRDGSRTARCFPTVMSWTAPDPCPLRLGRGQPNVGAAEITGNTPTTGLARPPAITSISSRGCHVRQMFRSFASSNIREAPAAVRNPCSARRCVQDFEKSGSHDQSEDAIPCYGSMSKRTGLASVLLSHHLLRARSDHQMREVFPRRNLRRLDRQVRSYGVTAVLGLATLGGVAPRCQPAPVPVAAPAIAPVSDVQNAVVDSVNQHREAAGRAPLAIDGRLSAAAQSHTEDLARRQTMSHAGTGGTDGGQRTRNAGYRWSTWGENVAAGQTTAADVMSVWMASPGHRANILYGSVNHIGVAATKGADGVVYWTMVIAAGG